MHDFSDSFMEFLRTNRPTDYYKAMSDDVKPDVLASIKNSNEAYFAIWEKVPYSIRVAHGGRVPAEIMELAARDDYVALRNIEQGKPAHPEETDNSNASAGPSPAEMVAAVAFYHALTSGYSPLAAKELAEHRKHRHALRDKALKGTLTEEEKKSWRKSREQDKETIEKDWHKTQPEKLLVRLFAQYNHGKISKEELLPRVADLMQKIESDNRREHLVEYLNTRPIQAKLSRFSDEVIDLMSQTILHKVVRPQRPNKREHAVSLTEQINTLIDNANKGKTPNLQKNINQLVQQLAAKENGMLDLRDFGADSQHPMPAELRQMFMTACCINNVPYQSTAGERINLNSEYVRSLPENIQALVASRDMAMAKQNKVQRTGATKDKAQLVNNVSMIVQGHERA